MRSRAIVLALILGVAACGSATSGDTSSTTMTGGDTTMTEASPSTDATVQSTATTEASTTSTTAAPSTTTTSAATTTTAETTSTTAASTTTTTRVTSTTTAATTTTTSAGKTVEVEIESFRFTPANITIEVGDSIRWVTTSGTHTSTSTGAWDTGVLATGESDVIKYDQPGTFSYFCSIHPGMQGTVTVEG